MARFHGPSGAELNRRAPSPMMDTAPKEPTPRSLVQLINRYLTGEASWEEVKALAAETTFTHREKPVYGTDDYTDVESWEDTVGMIFKLSTDQESELKALAKFV